jgi:hypothetical protein
VRTGAGQACQTPCSLTLAVQSQSVTFTKDGFLPQTIQITVNQPPPEHSLFSSRPPPALTPNPVNVALLVAPPPRPLLQVAPQPAPPAAWPAPPLVQPAPPPPPSNAIPWFPS